MRSKVRKLKRRCLLFSHPIYAKRLLIPLCPYLNWKVSRTWALVRNTFPKLGAYMSMGACLNPERLIGGLRYYKHFITSCIVKGPASPAWQGKHFKIIADNMAFAAQPKYQDFNDGPVKEVASHESFVLDAFTRRRSEISLRLPRD